MGTALGKRMDEIKEVSNVRSSKCAGFCANPKCGMMLMESDNGKCPVCRTVVGSNKDRS